MRETSTMFSNVADEKGMDNNNQVIVESRVKCQVKKAGCPETTATAVKTDRIALFTK